MKIIILETLFAKLICTDGAITTQVIEKNSLKAYQMWQDDDQGNDLDVTKIAFELKDHKG